MELIDQHTKGIMEGCKERARDAGLRFQYETLEYIVTNRDLLELSPKMMIPTLYDYWVHDVEVLKEKGKYELYPGNPYETVINTRPAISFYNDNNPDWLNVMIFYHVIAHIDFFQNNLNFRHTWEYDFTGQALSDKRLIASLRSEHGRWVDYIIEFARSIDNIVGFHDELSRINRPKVTDRSLRLDYYFDVFLQKEKKVKVGEYLAEVERYNACLRESAAVGEQTFFNDAAAKYPEFEALFEKYRKEKKAPPVDLLQHILEHSEFLAKPENRWMKSVIEVVRKTSLFFQPQIRTKIMNEGWASYWHETLFLRDDRISSHEVDFARVNAFVTSLPRVGMNPYALGMRLFYDIEKRADRGMISMEFDRLLDADKRKNYDQKTASGRDYIFRVRENMSDFTFVNTFVDQAFVDDHDLFVSGKRLNKDKMVYEYYVKSRRAGEYRKMLLDMLYHPPKITVEGEKGENGELYLVHGFEGKPLVKDYIANTLMGIEYLWGGTVHLETSEPTFTPAKPQGGVPVPSSTYIKDADRKREIKWHRFLYTMKKRNLSKKFI